MIGSGIGGLQSIAETAVTLKERGPRRVSPFFIPGALINLISGQVSIRYGFKGPNHSVVTACSTGAHAIGDASRLIKFGDAEFKVIATETEERRLVAQTPHERSSVQIARCLAGDQKERAGWHVVRAAAPARRSGDGRGRPRGERIHEPADDDAADHMARRVMDLWTEETWKHETLSTRRRFRPGMLSWNYWVGDGYVMAASADGRPKGQFLSNAICPSNGADVNGPTANANSVGKALGGMAAEGDGDWGGYLNLLPNGASHTMTFNPSLLRDGEHRDKFKAFLRGYCRNGGTALQVNLLDAELLQDAQRHPEQHRDLVVKVSGYSAGFVDLGRSIQDDIIARTEYGM